MGITQKRKPSTLYKVLLLAFLVILATYVTLYALEAHQVARYALKLDNTACWRYTPPGSFFPWPKEPGPCAALSKMSSMDQFIFLYFVETRILIVVSILSWILVAVYSVKSNLPLFRPKLTRKP